MDENKWDERVRGQHPGASVIVQLQDQNLSPAALRFPFLERAVIRPMMVEVP